MTRLKTALRHRTDALSIAAGLTWTQAIAFVAVLHSNAEICRSATALRAAGWFAIPTGAALDPLTTFSAAFNGALFFTLSIGAGLSLATWGAVRLWRYSFPRGRRWHWGVVTGAAVFCALVNARGWVWFPTLLVAGVILTTGLIAGSAPRPPHRSGHGWVPVLTLVLLSALWATQLNQNLFISIRDRLLLSNPVGEKVNDFYYRNTLYAAEVFKSFNQKTLRACRIEGLEDPAVTRRLTALLAARDVLAIIDDRPVDLTLRFSPSPAGNPPQKADERSLALETRDHRKIFTDPAQFMGTPSHWLRTLSDLSDRYAPFRRLTLLALLLGLPILVYALVYGILRRVSALFLSDTRSTWTASGICLAVGILLYLPVVTAQFIRIAPEKINAALASGDLPRRLAALQFIEEKKMEIARFPAYGRLLDHAAPVERCYLARAMALSREESTYRVLLGMLDDPHPNVVCQACYALGQRGRKTAVPAIIDTITQSAHWYTQWYGYNAIRRLGWRQTRSE